MNFYKIIIKIIAVSSEADKRQQLSWVVVYERQHQLSEEAEQDVAHRSTSRLFLQNK